MIEIRDIRAFVALAEHRHFAHAATSLGLSQPAFSARIRHLERALRLTLVQRGSRFSGFTLEGERLLPWARRLLADTTSLTDVAADSRARLDRIVTLGCIPSALPYAGAFAQQAQRLHPELTFSILSMNAQDIRAGIVDFRLDGGISYVDGDAGPAMHCTALYRESYMAVLPREWPLAIEASLDWAAMARCPMALLSPDMQFRQIVDRAFIDAGVKVEPRLVSNVFASVIAYCRAARVATILPQAWASAVVDPDFAFLPLPPVAAMPEIALLTRREEPLPPIIKALIQAASTMESSKA